MRGSGGVWRLWERSGRIYFGDFGPPPAPGGGNAPTSTRMPRARPAAERRSEGAILDMRAELGRGRVQTEATRRQRKQRVGNGSNAYAAAVEVLNLVLEIPGVKTDGSI